VVRELTPHAAQRTPARSKALKAGSQFWSRLRKWTTGVAVNRHEGIGHRRGGAAAQEGKPLKGEPRMWLRGEINPQGSERRKPPRG
jgi:hypothetical protein